MEVKQQSTGNNDSVEDAVIAIMNIKTTEGKLINFNAQVKAVYKALAVRELYAPQPKQTEALRMAIEIMQRYLKETPLGNQPHMIAHKAEEAIQACKEALAETQEPVLVNATTHDGQTYKIEVSAPSREWVGLSDVDIEEGFKEGWVTKQAFESAVWWAEAKLKEKNNGTQT